MKKINLAFLLLSLAVLAGGPAVAAPLYFPHVDTNPPWQTEIAIINTSAVQGVTGTLRGLNNQGQFVESKMVAIPALGRTQITIATEFTNHTGIRYIVFDTDADTIEGYTKFFIEGSYRAAVPAVKRINASDIYVSHIDSSTQWWTGLSLVNTTSEVKNVTITFNNSETRTRTLDANGHDAFTIGELFGNQPLPGIQSAVITNAGGIIGLELFGTNDGRELEGILLTDRTASTLYYPHVDSNGWWTGIVAYNPSALDAAITITPYDAGGNPLPLLTDSISGGGKFVGVVSQLGLSTQTAWFKIASTQPLTGFELFGTIDDRKLGAYAGNGGGGSRAGIFAKIEKNGGSTGIAFVNTEGSAASVTLTAYADNGTPGATRVLTVGGNAKVVDLAETIFSPLDISSATYIAFSADRDIVGFQLNGSSEDLMLDGLPALGGAPRVAVSAVSPADGATDILTTATVSVTFNQAMNSATINATTFQVTTGGTPVAGTISASGNTYTFTPTGSLAAGTLYAVTVTTGVTDVVGNALAENFTSTFTTAGGAAIVAVSIGDFFFAPASVTVNAGDTVIWTNTGFALHTTTSGTTSADGIWASPFLANGQFFSFTFTQAGVFPYFCAVHPFMTGTVTVQ